CPPADPCLAPLPGGVWAPDARPCGYILYGSAEYLLWWIRDAHLPVLLAQGPVIPTGGNPMINNILVGNNSVAPQLRSGGRFTLGGWFNECQNWGLEGTFL